MGYIAYLERGGRKIQIDDTGLYRLAPAWTPPTINLTSTYASGTGASAYSPPMKIAERTQQALISIPFHIRGASSDTQVNDALSRLNSFLRDAGNENEPTYFTWLSNNDIPTLPLWGQYVRRLKISDGAAYFGGEYGMGNVNQQAVPRCRLDLTVCAIEGSPQRIGFAKGGIVENNMISTDGFSSGMIVCPAITNLVTNPVMDSGVTTGYTARANSAIAASTAEYIPAFGAWSLRVRALNVGAQEGVYYTATVAASTQYSCSMYVKPKRAGTVAVRISDNIGAIGTSGTLTLTSNVWQRVSVTGTTAGGANQLFVNLETVAAQALEMYTTGWQVEAYPYPTPLATGDMIGCAWASTVHASNTTRAAGWWSIPSDGFANSAGGSLRLAVTPFASSTALTENKRIFVDGTSFLMRWTQADAKWHIEDGTNSATSAATTFTAGTPIIFHVVWGESGLTIYANGASIATNSAYAPVAAFGTNFYIGSSSGPSQHFPGTFAALATWDVELTSTQIAADYANLSQLITTGKNPAPIPWLWSQDGDGVIDDITDADQAAYGVIGGIDGDVQTALTIVQHSASADTLYVGIYATDNFVEQKQMYDTAVVSVDTTPTTGINPTLSTAATKALRDYPVYMFSEIQDAGTNNLEINSYLYASNSYLPVDVEIAALDEQIIDVPSAALKVYDWVGLRMPNGTEGTASIKYILDYRRTAGEAANVTTHCILWFGNLARIAGYPITTNGGIMVVGKRAYQTNYTASNQLIPLVYRGGGMFATPGKINHIFSAFADSGDPWYPSTIDYAKYTPVYLNA